MKPLTPSEFRKRETKNGAVHIDDMLLVLKYSMYLQSLDKESPSKFNWDMYRGNMGAATEILGEHITDEINAESKYYCRGSFVLHTLDCENKVEDQYSMCDECRDGVANWRESIKVLNRFKEILYK